MLAINPKRRASGFTLVELLVVIGIIALLIAVLMPALKQARYQANAVVCQSNMRQVGVCIGMYVHDNKNRYPWPGRPGGHYADFMYAQPTRTDGKKIDDSVLQPYLKTKGERLKAIFICPQDLALYQSGYNGGTAWQLSYTMNYGTCHDYQNNIDNIFLSANEVRRSSEKVLLIDEDEHSDDGQFSYGTARDSLCDRHGGLVKDWVDHGGGRVDGARRQGNVLWFDGHVTLATNDLVHQQKYLDPKWNQ